MLTWGFRKKVGNGREVLFWTDRWLGEYPLSDLYPQLFSVATDIGISVALVLDSRNINLVFRRQLTGGLRDEWYSLVSQMRVVHLDIDETDTLSWRWNTNGRFTVNSFYSWLEYGGIQNVTFNTIWKAKIPFKIKIFLWLVKQDKILTRVNLSKRGWLGDVSCQFCGAPETIDHLFVQCPFFRTIWNWIADYNNFAFDITTMEELWFIDALIPFKDRYLIELVRGAVLWVMWLTRNKLCFHGIHTSLRSIGSQIISLAQFWVRSKGRGTLLTLSLVLPTDVMQLPVFFDNFLLQEVRVAGTSGLEHQNDDDNLLVIHSAVSHI